MSAYLENFASIGSTPVLSSEHLGWSNINLTQWNRISPNVAYDGSLHSKHLITIHGSSNQMKIHTHEQASALERVTQSGDIQILPVGAQLHCQWTQAMSFLKMEIAPAFINQVAFESGFGDHGKLELERKNLFRDSKLLQLSDWMVEELRNGGASGKLYRDSLANMTVVHLLQHYTTRSHRCNKPNKLTNQQVSIVMEYMQANLDKDMSLEELAVIGNVSLSHLVRLFKQQTSFTPHQYLIRLRIERSKRLIRCGNSGMKDIAVQVGFSDQGHFSRLFKRETGFTPMQYATDLRIRI